MSSNREQRLIEIELDSINSLSDVSEYLTKYKHKQEILCSKTKYIIEDDKVIIYDIETENEEQKLKLKYNFSLMQIYIISYGFLTILYLQLDSNILQRIPKSAVIPKWFIYGNSYKTYLPNLFYPTKLCIL